VSFVDYDRAARRYDAGRGLSDDTLECWRRAVIARVVPAGRIVLDVGAGTGVFAAAWVAWGARAVVAVEPSEAMRRQAPGRVGAGVVVVGGRAEALPVGTSSIDVVWMSAVLHHLSDPERCACEVRRVLRPGGHLLVRGYVPDRSRVPPGSSELCSSPTVQNRWNSVCPPGNSSSCNCCCRSRRLGSPCR